ncbi:carbohydrate-binding protein [Natrinema salaciae]|uniref:carbohydrate-binding protein n=1 Tax=Natrinema salaciae TaxID=1186196 RepID=UPI0011137316
MTRKTQPTDSTDEKPLGKPTDTPSASRQRRTDSGSDRVSDRTSRGRSSRRGFLHVGASALAATALCGTTVAAQTTDTRSCGSFDTIDVGDGDFLLINNDWGTDAAGGDVEMCIWANDDGTYGFDWDTRTTEGEPNYPQALVGTKPWGTDTGADPFPVPRGEVAELELTYDVDLEITGENWNLAEEWWLLDGQPNPSGSHVQEIMLVLEWGDEHTHGPPAEPGAIEDAHGNVIDHWVSYDSGGTNADFHIFRLAEGSASGTVDLTAIMEYVSDEVGVSDDLLLSGIELGTEYWAGTSGDVTYNTFDVTINGQTYSSGSDGQDGSDDDQGGSDDDQDGSDDDQDDSDDDQGGSDDDQGGSGDGQDGSGDDQDGSDDQGDSDDGCGSYPAWDPKPVYTDGDRVTHDGTVWEAQWWTQNQEPRNEDWYVWQPVE